MTLWVLHRLDGQQLPEPYGEAMTWSTDYSDMDRAYAYASGILGLTVGQGERRGLDYQALVTDAGFYLHDGPDCGESCQWHFDHAEKLARWAAEDAADDWRKEQAKI